MTRISKKKFSKLLKERPFENISIINLIEGFLRKKRGYVIRIPKKDTNIIHLVSGGIDSVVTWAMLMEEYGLRVHPISLKTGQKRHKHEIESLKFYSAYFKERYPKLFVGPFDITYLSSPPEIASRMRYDIENNVHPQILKENYDAETNTIRITRKYLFPAFVPFPAARCALFFDMQRNLEIRTLSMSVLPTDGLYNESQTLTSLRGAMLGLCTFTNDYRWQIFSPCFERELGSILTKADLIKWAKAHRLPLKYTYSCFRATPRNCGACLACGVRRGAFKEAGIKDPTIYEEDNPSFSGLIQKKFAPLKEKIHRMTGGRLGRKPRIIIKDYTY